MKKLSVVLVLFFCLKSQAEQLGFSLESQIASPAVLIPRLFDDWAVNDIGDYAYGRGRLNSWFEVRENWRFGYKKRADYLVDFSPDTAQFYTRLENGDVPAGSYDLNMSVNALMAEGISLAYKFSFDLNNHLYLEGNIYKGALVQLADLQGVGTVDENGDYRFVYDFTYHFDHSRWLDSPEEEVSGWGYGVNLVLDYSLGRRWQLRGQIEDLYASMHWSQVNRDRASCDSTEAGFGCNGASRVVSKSQDIRSYSNWKVYGIKGEFRPFVQWESWARYEAWQLGMNYRRYSAGWDFVNEVVNFTYESDRLQVEWAFDNINANNAHHWQITLGTVWPIF